MAWCSICVLLSATIHVRQCCWVRVCESVACLEIRIALTRNATDKIAFANTTNEWGFYYISVLFPVYFGGGHSHVYQRQPAHIAAAAAYLNEALEFDITLSNRVAFTFKQMVKKQNRKEVDRSLFHRKTRSYLPLAVLRSIQCMWSAFFVHVWIYKIVSPFLRCMQYVNRGDSCERNIV